MATPIQPTGLNFQSIKQSCKPPAVICVPLDFAAASQYTLNLKQLQDLGVFDVLVTIYVDNRANPNVLDMLMSGTLQDVSAAAKTQGYYPVIANNPAELTFTSAGGAKVNVFLLNFEVSPAVWTPGV